MKTIQSQGLFIKSSLKRSVFLLCLMVITLVVFICSISFLKISNVTAQTTSLATNNNNNMLDITIVGSGFDSNDPNFATMSVKSAKFLTSVEPYKSYAHQINFHIANIGQDFGCKPKTTNDNTMSCFSPDGEPFQDHIINTLSERGYPTEKVVVIANIEGTYGTAYKNIASANGPHRTGTVVVMEKGEEASKKYLVQYIFAHEFSHLMGLNDEYTVEGGVTAELTAPANTVIGNCWSGPDAPPSNAWSVYGYVSNSADARKGCSNPNWYRSSPCSIMISYACLYFNKLSQAIISTEIKQYAPTATTAPVGTELPILNPANQPGTGCASIGNDVTWSIGVKRLLPEILSTVLLTLSALVMSKCI